MAKELVVVIGDDLVNFCSHEEGILLVGMGFGRSAGYPEDYEVCSLTAPGAWAISAVFKLSIVFVGLIWGQNMVFVVFNAVPSVAFVVGHPGPKRFAGGLLLFFEGLVFIALFFLLSIIIGLSGAGGEVFVGLSDSFGENGVFVGFDVDGMGNFWVYVVICFVGVEII